MPRRHQPTLRFLDTKGVFHTSPGATPWVHRPELPLQAEGLHHLNLVRGLRWVSERLGMGNYSRVSQAVSRMHRAKGRKSAHIRRLLANDTKNAVQD